MVKYIETLMNDIIICI